MPKKSMKPCSNPCCPELTVERFCIKHKRNRHQEYDRYRESAAKRGYDSRWRKARLHFLRRNPLCVHCEEKGFVEVATVVDHVKAHRGDKRLFWDKENWQALCASCHSRKTVAEDGGFGLVKK